MANGNMFGNLKQYRNNIHYYGKNPIINLNSNYACYQYKIFAFFIVDAFDKTDTYFDYWNKINFADEGDFYYFVNEAKRRTIRLNDVDVKYGDQLLTLSTCNGIFGEGKGGRFVVLARRVREGEDPYEGTQNSTANPNIKWPSIYYRYNKNSKYDPDAEFVPYG
jgi:sortase B